MVILSAIWTKLGIEPRPQFVVIGEGDAIVLKQIAVPSLCEFDGVIERAREAARRACVKRSDLASAITVVRSR